MRRKKISTLMSGLFVFCSASDSFAATGKYNTAYGGVWITLAIVYLTRKMKFGGWLFYYYLMTYAGFLVMIFSEFPSLESFSPTVWYDNAMYTLFIITTIPGVLLMIVETIVATLFFFKRNQTQKYVDYLKYILLGQFVVKGVTAYIEYYNFPESFMLTAIACVVSLVWHMFFRKSYRVNWIVTNTNMDWNYEAFDKSKPWIKVKTKA